MLRESKSRPMMEAEYHDATPRERRAIWRKHKRKGRKESAMRLAAKIAMILLCLGAGAFLALAWPDASDVPPRGVMDATR